MFESLVIVKKIGYNNTVDKKVRNDEKNICNSCI